MKFYTRFQRGFTLVEMAIVILIIGLLFAFLGRIYSLYIYEKQQSELKETVSEVRSALADFIQDDPKENDPLKDPVRYPCPASPFAVPGDANFGVEQRDSTNTTCLAGNGVEEWTNATGTETVFIGSVPTNTLDIAAKYMLDPYNNRLTYAVTGALAATGGMLNPGLDAGVVEVQTDAPEPVKSDFALVSHGKTGFGAYTLQGIQMASCNGTDGDQENCDGDNIFALDVAQTSAQGPGFFDDAGAFTLADDGNGWWTATNESGRDIYNLNPGKIGVGVTAPEASFHILNNYGNNNGDKPAEVRAIAGDYGVLEVVSGGDGAGETDDNDVPYYSLNRADKEIAWQLGLFGEKFTIAVGDDSELDNIPETDLFSSKVFVIDGTGKIGIGTDNSDITSTPAARLHVRETDHADVAFRVENNYGGNLGERPAGVTLLPGDYGIFEVSSGGTGAGETDDNDVPYYSLSRKDKQVAWQIGLFGEKFTIAVGDGIELDLPLNSNGDPVSRTDLFPLKAMTIDGQGNVGIGTTDPQAPLDVAGEIKVGDSGLLCTAQTRGAMRYSAAADEIQYCSQTGWAALKKPDPEEEDGGGFDSEADGEQAGGGTDF